MKRRATRRPDSFLIRADRALRSLRGELDGLSDPRFQAALQGSGVGFSARLRHPATEVRGRSRGLRGGGRDLAAADPYARKFLSEMTLNVPGPHGIQRRAAVKVGEDMAIEVNTVLDVGFLDWASTPVTTDRKHTLPALEDLLWRTVPTDGELFLRMVDFYPGSRYGLALQVVDADQIDAQLNQDATSTTREIRMGVEIDEWGAATGFIVRDNPTGAGFSYGRRSDPYRVSAYDPRTGDGDMIHCYVSLRANQVRGLSWFAPIMDTAERRLRYTEAHIMAALKGAAQPTVLQARAENAAELMEDVPASDNEEDAAAERMRRYRPELEIDPEVINAIPPGWEIAGVSSDYPSTNYPDFLRAILREYASALGISYEVLANDRENVNFSSLRDGKNSERDFYRKCQQFEIQNVLEPVSRRWLRNAVLLGAATSGSQGLLLPGGSLDWRAYTDAAWDPRGWDDVQPLEEMQRAALGIKLGLTSRTREAARRGQRWADIAAELSKEHEVEDLLGLDFQPPGTVQTDVQKSIDEGKAAAATSNGNGKGGKPLRAGTAPNLRQRLATLLGGR